MAKIKTVVVGLSGGVDSSVSAYLLKKQGYKVIGVFMRNWDSLINNDIKGNKFTKDNCPIEKDLADAKAVAKQLDIEFHEVNFIKEYWDNVFEDLIEQYKKGRTPNPDILCNKYIKFGSFKKWIEEKFPDCDYVATGHYADLEKGILKKPHDSWKDQTYFLAQVSKEQLANVIFPLAKLPKKEVRKIAKEQNLVVAQKKDSTGICFIGERNFTDFLQNYIPSKPGNIIDVTNNKVVGKHVGAMYYTIGQRKGLNLGGMKEPYFVVGHNLQDKVIYVAPLSEKKYLLSDEAIISDINWLGQKEEGTYEVKFRYKSQSVKCQVEWLDDKTIKVKYPDFEAVTLGQQAVFYKGDYCLGGGIIDKVYYKGKEKIY